MNRKHASWNRPIRQYHKGTIPRSLGSRTGFSVIRPSRSRQHRTVGEGWFLTKRRAGYGHPTVALLASSFSAAEKSRDLLDEPGMKFPCPSSSDIALAECSLVTDASPVMFIEIFDLPSRFTGPTDLRRSGPTGWRAFLCSSWLFGCLRGPACREGLGLEACTLPPPGGPSTRTIEIIVRQSSVAHGLSANIQTPPSPPFPRDAGETATVSLRPLQPLKAPRRDQWSHGVDGHSGVRVLYGCLGYSNPISHDVRRIAILGQASII